MIAEGPETVLGGRLGVVYFFFVNTSAIMAIWKGKNIKNNNEEWGFFLTLNVHNNENFFGSDIVSYA